MFLIIMKSLGKPVDESDAFKTLKMLQEIYIRYIQGNSFDKEKWKMGEYLIF